MIEAVGWQYFDEFFRCCDELLTPDGLMLLQAITIDDPSLRDREGRPQLRQHPRLPRRLPALPGSDRALSERAIPRCERSGSTTSPSTTRRPSPPGASASGGAWEPAPRERLRRALPPTLVLLPELLRGGLPRAADRRRAGSAGETGVAMSPSGEPLLLAPRPRRQPLDLGAGASAAGIRARGRSS